MNSKINSWLIIQVYLNPNNSKFQIVNGVFQFIDTMQ
jgi:hypothetical protein